MLRSGRFRHRLLDDVFLKTQSARALECLIPFLQKWEQGFLGDAEMAGIYVTILTFLRRPCDFLSGPQKDFSAHSSLAKISGAEFVQILRSQLPLALRENRSLLKLEENKSFLEILCSYNLRSVPLAAMRGLACWHQGAYPLQLWTSIPSPLEVLAMQAQGERCVSMFTQLAQIETPAEDGRDALGFLLHDLIHADHFFADPENAQAQILFSQKLQQLWEKAFWQDLLSQDDVFKGEFHYLMSDMNSVPLHLLKTLKAQLLGHIKRQLQIPLTEPLPESHEPRFRELFLQALEPWAFTDSALAAAHRLNSRHYQHPDDSYILHQEMVRT